jgi:hypothetical protein
VLERAHVVQEVLQEDPDFLALRSLANVLFAHAPLQTDRPMYFLETL